MTKGNVSISIQYLNLWSNSLYLHKFYFDVKLAPDVPKLDSMT